MKCKNCKHIYTAEDNICPFCKTYNENSKCREKFYNFLNRRVKTSKLAISNIDLFLILCVNFIILSAFLNFITYFTIDLKLIWAQYPIMASYLFYAVLKHYSKLDFNSLFLFDKIIYSIIWALAISYFTIFNQQFPIVIVICSLVLFLSLISLILLLLGSSRFSFILTAIINSLITTVFFVLTFIKTISFTQIELAFIYLTFGVNIFIMINFFIVHIISLITNIKDRI